jgi:hypothetical protein
MLSMNKSLVAILAAALAGLASGHLWLRTGSLLFALASGIGVFLFLMWFLANLGGKKKQQTRVYGEARDDVSEDEFTRLVEVGEVTKERLQKRVEEKPEQVAESLRSMLNKKKD